MSVGTRSLQGRGRGARLDEQHVPPQGETDFNNRTSLGASILQADTLQQAAERAGKKVASVEWVGARTHDLQGPVIDFRNFFSTRGVLDVACSSPASRRAPPAFGVSYQVAALRGRVRLDEHTCRRRSREPTPAGGADGRDDVRGAEPEREPTTSTSTTASSTARLPTTGSCSTRTGVAKNAAQAAANLGVGDWVDVRLTGADGLIGARAGQTAGFYVKLIGLTGSAGSVGSFKLYFTSVSRAIASCACDPNFESTLVDKFPTSTAADFAPLEAGIIDEDTYVEQGLKWADFHLPALDYILKTAAAQHRPAHAREPDDGRVPAPVHGAGDADGHGRRRRTRTSTTSPTTTSPTGGRRSARGTSAPRITRPTTRSSSGAR